MRSLFCVNDDIFNIAKGTKLLIYGFGKEEKSFLMRLAEVGIMVEGFLVEDNHSELSGITYLGRRLYFFGDIAGREDEYTVLLTTGENFCNIHHKFHGSVIRGILPVVNKIVIYGAGARGALAFDFLKKFNVDVLCFCDRNRNKQRSAYCGLKVIAPEKLRDDYHDTPVLIALDPLIIEDALTELMQNGIVADGQVYWWNRVFFVDPNFTLRTGDFVGAHTIYRLLYMTKTRKNLVLWGSKDDVERIAKVFSCFGLSVSYAIDLNEFEGFKNGVTYRSAWDLLYEDEANLLVVVLFGAKEKAQRFSQESGINENAFIMYGGWSIKYGYLLDPTLGYNIRSRDEESVITIPPLQSPDYGKKTVSVGVVGGSTSSVLLYNEVSWPEHLAKLAAKEKKSVKIYAGGTGGYNVSQELLKFVRDMSHKKLDILISFSRVNEFTKSHPFLHDYQEMVCKKLAEHYQSEPIYGIIPEVYDVKNSGPKICRGIPVEDIAENWFHQERILHGVCQEFGIRFYSIVQPWLFDKSILSLYDREIIENVDMTHEYIESRRVDMNHIRDFVKEKTSEVSWLYDFTDTFEGCDELIYLDAYHVTSRGNQIIANRIYELIKDELL